MAVARKLDLWAGVTVACAALIGGTNVEAQPLVTGDLSIYYDFDSFTDVVMDASGNNLDAKVRDTTRKTLDEGFDLFTSGVISNDTSNPLRGAGAVRFSQSALGEAEDPVFLDLDGSVIKANAPTKVPKEAITVAAWVNVPLLNMPGQNNPGSILQAASSGPSFVTHFHIEGDGRIRLALRGEFQADNIANSSGAPFVGHPYPNQPEIDANGAPPEPWPIDEWHHVAFTYDKVANSFSIYYDGTEIRTGAANGNAGAIDLGAWDLRAFGDFYDGLGIRAVMDGAGGRRLHGLMDEFYIFTRALTDAEIGTLALVDDGLDGDYNGDGTVNAADYAVWRDGGSPDDTQAGYDLWRANFGDSGSGASAAVPEPSTLALLFVCLGIMVARRRK